MLKKKIDGVQSRKCSQCHQTGHTKRNCQFVPLTGRTDNKGGSSMGVDCYSGVPRGSSFSSPTYWMPSTSETFTGIIDFNYHCALHVLLIVLGIYITNVNELFHICRFW